MVWRAAALHHGTKHLNLAQELENLKENPKKGEAFVGVATTSHQWGESADQQHRGELQDGCCFTSTSQIFQSSLWASLPRNIQEREFWELSFRLARWYLMKPPQIDIRPLCHLFLCNSSSGLEWFKSPWNEDCFLTSSYHSESKNNCCYLQKQFGYSEISVEFSRPKTACSKGYRS